MTEEIQTRYDEVKESIKKKKRLEEILGKTEHPASQVHDPADDAIKREIYDFYIKEGELPQGVATPDDMKGDILTAGIKEYQKFYTIDAGSIFKANVDNVVSNIPVSDLETLASQNVILSSSEGPNREILLRYKEYKTYEDLKNRYENNKGLTEEEQDHLKQHAEKGAEEYVKQKRKTAMDKERDRQISRGYQSKRLLGLAGNLAEMAVKISLSNRNEAAKLHKEFILSGLTKQIEESKKKYDDLAYKEHDYLVAVKNTLRNLGESDDTNKFGIGLYALENPKGLDDKYLKQH